MLETTLVSLQDIMLDKILDEAGRKILLSEFPKIMQQVRLLTFGVSIPKFWVPQLKHHQHFSMRYKPLRKPFHPARPGNWICFHCFHAFIFHWDMSFWDRSSMVWNDQPFFRMFCVCVCVQGFAYLPAGICVSSMGRPVSYEQAIAWKVLDDNDSYHCLSFMFLNWSFV